jgi:hypothetical protein
MFAMLMASGLFGYTMNNLASIFESIDSQEKQMKLILNLFKL